MISSFLAKLLSLFHLKTKKFFELLDEINSSWSIIPPGNVVDSSQLINLGLIIMILNMFMLSVLFYLFLIRSRAITHCKFLGLYLLFCGAFLHQFGKMGDMHFAIQLLIWAQYVLSWLISRKIISFCSSHRWGRPIYVFLVVLWFTTSISFFK
jgi:hypothetical protein